MKRIAAGLTAVFISVFMQIILPSLSFGDFAYYLYDDTGRLGAVIDAQSNGIVYEYDEVGNLISVTEKIVTGAIAITDFDPHEGVEDTEVSIYGKGFSPTPSDNTVEFNAVQATVTSSTETIIVTSVPAGATTGKITVTNTNGTATSDDDFTVLLPITSITVSPETAFMFAGNRKQFKAYADGIETKRVSWSVEGTEGGSYFLGTITKNGLYTAPFSAVSVGEATITATSLLDLAISGNATVFFNSAVVAAPVSVSIVSPFDGSVMTSNPVSVSIGSLLDGSVMSSNPVSVSFPATIDALVSASVSVYICPNLPVRVSGASTVYYSTLQAAYDAALDGETIQSQAIDLNEDFTANRDISVILEGGYDCDYTAIIDKTGLKGLMRTSNGKLRIRNFVLKE